MSHPHPYLRPDTLEDALEALASGGFRPMAGCTDLYPATEAKTLGGPMLDVTGIRALRGITTGTDGVRIGAATTWTDIVKADLPPAFDGLKAAAREVGATQIQNRGTIGGNLCNASPAADGVPPLLTLDASVTLASQSGVRDLPLAEFITGPRRIALRPDELLTAVTVPATALGGQGGFLKLGARSYLVISIAMVAVRVSVAEGRITEAALSVGACGPVATRLQEVEAALRGQPRDGWRLDHDAVGAALSPIDDVRADAGYRRRSAGILLDRALTAALGERMAA